MAQKKIVKQIKLQVEAGKATPAPPIGPALGQAGVNIKEFCDQFNNRTKDKVGLRIPVVVTVYSDRSFTFITKSPPASVLILKELGLEKGSKEPGIKKIGKLTKAQLQKIAEIKKDDLNANSIEAAIQIIAGTCRSMGVDVEL